MKKTLLTLLTVLLTLSVFSQTLSNGNGNWNAIGSWNPASIPPDNGDTVFIEAGDQISINSNTTYTTALVIVVRGTFTLNQTLSLASGSQIVIEPGGEVNSGNNGWRLDIGAMSWKDFKKDPQTGGILTDIVLSINSIEFEIFLINDRDLSYNYTIDGIEIELRSVVIEKSNDGKSFFQISELSNELSGMGSLYEVVNTKYTFYRIKALEGNKNIYSDVVMIENQNFEMSIYPNPFKGVVNVNVQNDSNDYTFKVYDIIGNLIEENQLNSVIDLRDKENGIYFLKVFYNNELIANKQLIKN